jgi:hypothetical protein
MRLIWVVIPLVFLGIVGMQESFAEDFSYNWGKIYFWEDTNIDSPKVQVENGVEPREVICKSPLYLVYKTLDGSPACVKEYLSAPKLIDRGWATLGETFLEIITDKEVYSIGENVTITMKNEGETLLIFNSRPDFDILDTSQKWMELPTDTIQLPTDRIATFDTIASTTFVWNQTKVVWDQTTRNLEQVEPGIYSVFAKYRYPIPINDSPQIGIEWMETIKTFEISAIDNFK